MLPGAKAAQESASALVNDLFGPSAKYLGNRLQQWLQDRTEARVINVNRILSAAERKVHKHQFLDGSIHPGVLKELLDDGAFLEDQLSTEYFGGVLASSRSTVSRDDRGALLAR
jgi:hypothetical protein